MKKVLLLFISICAFYSHAQNPPIDSLLTELSKAKEDTGKVNLLNSLCDELALLKSEECLKYATQGIALSEKLKWHRGYGLINFTLGTYYYRKQNYPEALAYYFKSLNSFDDLKDRADLAKVMSQIGNVYWFQEDEEKVLHYYNSALKINYEINNSSGINRNLINFGRWYDEHKNYPKALEYFFKLLEYHEKNGNKKGVAVALGNIQGVYENLSDFPKALDYSFKSLEMFRELKDDFNTALMIVIIGSIYHSQKEYSKSLEYFYEGLALDRQMDYKEEMADNYGKLGSVYKSFALDKNVDSHAKLNNLNKAMALQTAKQYYDTSIALNSAIGNLNSLISTYAELSETQMILGDNKAALESYKKHILFKDSVYSNEKSNNIIQLQMQFDFDKKETLAKAEQEKKDIRQRTIRNSIGGVLAGSLAFLIVVYRQRNKIAKARKRSDELLLNILPGEVAEELKEKGRADAKQFDEVTVMFTDFKNFTLISEKLTPTELVNEIHTCFKAFDQIIGKYGIEKIKTIGDSYMCAGGLPVVNKTHADDVVKAALDIQQFMQARLQQRESEGKEPFEIRIGIHTGPVVAGIVGVRKFAYDIWGDTVNTASRMESSGEAGKVNISGSTYELVKDKFKCEYRGKIQAKNKGEIDMYFVEDS
jgi:adenylate cyclase